MSKPPVSQPPTSGALPTRPEKPAHWKDIPESSDLDDSYHPGLGKAYQEATYQADGAFRERRNHACLQLLPKDLPRIEYDSLETYEPDGRGNAVLVSETLYPGSGGHEDFYSCLRTNRATGRVRVKLPDGFTKGFELRTGMLFMLGQGELTSEKVVADIRFFRHRLSDPDLGPEGRAYFENKVRRAECVLAHDLRGEACE
jgi:hypothetical protein